MAGRPLPRGRAVDFTHSEDGDNMLSPSTNCSWYRGWEEEGKVGKVTGKALLEAIGNSDPPSVLLTSDPHLPPRNVYKIGGISTASMGRVETGALKPGMVVTLVYARDTQTRFPFLSADLVAMQGLE